MFVPHRQNGDVMQRPYEYVRTIYGMYVTKLAETRELELRRFNNHCIVWLPHFKEEFQ